MEANRKEVDPSGQELIEGSTIAGEISSSNRTTPCPSAPPIEGRVKFSNDQKRESKREADRRSKMKRKREEAEMMKEQKEMEKYSGEMELENFKLKCERDHLEASVDEDFDKILSQLVDNYAGQNTEVQKARINFTGETSMGQDGLNELREVNQAPIMSNTIFGENASMNLQTLPRLAQPAGSSGLADDKKARRRITGKTWREKKKCMIDAAKARNKENKERKIKLESDKAVLNAEAGLLRKQCDQLRNINALLISKNARRDARLEKFLDGVELPWGMTPDNTSDIWEAGPPVHHPPVYLSETTIRPEGPAIEKRKGNKNYTSLLGAAMASGSSLMQGSLAPGGQLPFEVTGFGTGETGLPVHHPPVYQSGTTMGSGGLAIEDSPGLPQSHVSQGLTHLPSFGIGDQGSKSFDEDTDWFMNEYIAPLEYHKQEIESELEPPSDDLVAAIKASHDLELRHLGI